MEALIVYDSVFGNTEKTAAAMGDALGARVLKVSDFSPQDLDGISLLIVGSPTRAFRPTPAVTGWLKSLPDISGIRVAAFDTRIDVDNADSKVLRRMAKMFGYAAEKIQKALAKKDGAAAADPAWFFVTNSEGPLLGGELERAAAWAKATAEE